MDSVSDVVKMISCFDAAFYRNCVDSTVDNIVYSPLSIVTALKLVAEGADEATKDELRSSFELSDESSPSTLKNLNDFIEFLARGAGSAEFTIAHRIFVPKKYRVLGEFLGTALNDFGSHVQHLNFEKQFDSSEIINKFIEEKTKRVINNVIRPFELSARDRIIVVNVIYFKGTWMNTFNKNLTKKDVFLADATKAVSVDFMTQTNEFNFVDIVELDATALEMKYENSNLGFVIVLPKNRNGLGALEKKLKNFDLAKIVQEMQQKSVTVQIPKFKVISNINLKTILKKMDLTEMFAPDSADFSWLAEEIPDDPLFVSKFVHKCCITIFEWGTDVVGTSVRNNPSVDSFCRRFHADHPFVFYVWDRYTKTALFMGRIINITD